MSEENKKEVTIDNIAELIKLSAEKTEKNLEAKIISSANETTKALEAKIDSSVDMLARITQNNFLKLEADISEVKVDIGEVKEDTENIKADLNKKVDKIEYNSLVHMVEKMEEKLA